jgi:hypothetical protein
MIPEAPPTRRYGALTGRKIPSFVGTFCRGACGSGLQDANLYTRGLRV